jgi:hypothetical protein
MKRVVWLVVTIVPVLIFMSGCIPAPPAVGTGGNGGGTGGSSGTGGGSGTGGSGSGGAGMVSCGGASGADLANFGAVRDVVGFYCGGSGCHNDTTQPTIVDDASLYTTLTTYKAQLCGGRVLVKPCEPEESAFYLAQKGDCAPALDRMPLGCSVDTCVPDNYLEGIRQWIADGAPEK